MRILSHNQISGGLLRTTALALLLISLHANPLHADVAINIKGDIYGGGKQGNVGTENTANSKAQKNSVSLNQDIDFSADTTAIIVINEGSVRTVFGGGENGRTFGSTSITVNGGTVGDSAWLGTIHGGVFGAGDGDSAYVFGHSHVDIKGGTLVQNVYGGGNKADLMGTTNVTLQGGDIQAAVYGGARVANVFGYSLVNIDGQNATDTLIIGSVYGGNDIAGNITIPTFSNNWWWIDEDAISTPSILSAAANGYGIDKTWNAFVVSSHSATQPVYVAQLFGGGNGDYTYGGTEGHYTMSELKDSVLDSSTGSWTVSQYEFSNLASKPEVSKVYLELKGGNFGYVYGGGNLATVTDQTVICLDNSTSERYELNAQKMKDMGINLDVDKAAYTISGTGNAATSTPKYQFDRVFGGNKKADMAIHPKWHLIKGTINALYSGGDAGDMTYEKGLMLVLSSPDLEVNNVYGGCRRADVIPSDLAQINDNDYTEPTTGIKFDRGYSARVLVTAGKIGNVYGGNDISGDVYGGNAIEIRSSITGNVYGGGNGSYVYTDNKDYADDATYGDFYYGDFSAAQNAASVDSLNKFRPHTAKSYIHVLGSAGSVTHIPAVYGGGNSATVSDAIKLVLGRYTNIDNVFLGSNGLDMVNQENGGTLDLYSQISNLKLTDSITFNTYMQGAAVSCMPDYEFESGYPNAYNSSNDSEFAHIGSFYCGGNVGSMTSADSFFIKFERPIIITNKLVGGCNDAFVAKSQFNARNEGGFTVASATGEKVHLSVNGVIFANSVDTTSGNQGNIFGGCFNSGIINGNVVIDLQQNIIPSSSDINTGMDTYLANQSNLFNTPFSVFGGGFGTEATIKGNTAINITSDNVGTGKALKVFGGGYGGTVEGNTVISLKGGEIGKLYGGGFEGTVKGNTALYLTGGSVYDTFGGSCNADIHGYTQTYAGTGLNGLTGTTTIRNNIYGGNDFGGSINGFNDFRNKVSDASKVYNSTVTKASAYVEYVSGTISNYIFGGSCGNYNYNDPAFTEHKHTPSYPYLANAFVNFKPNPTSSSPLSRVFGAGQGYAGEGKADSEQDKMQDRSYVYVDIPGTTTKFSDTEFFGAGAYSGVGMGVNPNSGSFHVDSVSAVIDLVRGKINNAYGGGYEEGVTRRTVVNVPEGSTIVANAIFGGAYGIRNSAPCDVYESQVNFRSEDANIPSIFGGNNNKRRTLYAQVNIYAPVYTNKEAGWYGDVYGAGKGEGTWAQYTEVNLESGAGTYNVYGAGNAGKVLNIESLKAWKKYTPDASEGASTTTATVYRDLGTEWYSDSVLNMNLVHPRVINGETIIANTNVLLKEGSTGSYYYGAGLGDSANVYGTTFLGLYGANAIRDIYGSGSRGSVLKKDKKLDYTAQTWVYAESGTARNLYGGGWKGSVGYHNEASADTTNDVLGYSNVIVGKIDGTDFHNGIPAIQRNVYGGGEGGTIYGTANVTVNNGYVGFRYENGDYVEQLDDAKPGDNALDGSGNVFGGGYVINSFVDNTDVKMYGGTVRGNIYGGGEVGPIGRGNVRNSQTGLTPFMNGPAKIYKAGHTHVEMYGGHVMRNVFGGGRGIDSWGGNGSMFMDKMMSQQEIDACDWDSRGFIFGQTEVFIRGGEIGTPANVALGHGNVFGGGDLGYVYSGSSKKATSGDTIGLKSTSTLGYYYKHTGSRFVVEGSENVLTDDSRVIVEPYAMVKGDAGVTINDSTFAKGKYIPTDYLDKLKNKNADERWNSIDETGVTIRNAVFAGGNVSSGSDVVYANTNTVLGNATATLRDVYNKDLITIGTEHTGGLYGDGNLTLVDGYRELNITNYGTDYFSQPQEITLAEYRKMTDREKAYYELKYKCIKDTTTEDKVYTVNISISAEEYNKHFSGDTIHWKEAGFVSIYAGRLLNTIQRADFCGVFGSRMVLQGARDRVPEIVDYTNYTVNRVGEISLNQVKTMAGDTASVHKVHGNYFGIYSIVNYMGALTSDVDFYKDVRQWNNSDKGTYQPDSPTQTYYQWKDTYQDKRKRNNGTSANKVALASGVYLELTTEEGTRQDKVYGPITGVVELDLINVMVGLGGGYVYAKNIHGEQEPTGLEQTILSKYNLPAAGAHGKAVTNKAFRYEAPIAGTSELQTSGNFIHPQKQIVDDCYPNMASYMPGGSPAHYWYIKGSIYVYDQYISAYTGSANAYAESVNIPLTITAQSHGKIQMLEVQPSKYAFYSTSELDRNLRDHDKNGAAINNITYQLNDTISYWDWCLLGEADQKKFVDTTYTTIAACRVNGDSIPKGYVMLPHEYRNLRASVTDSILNLDTGYKAEFDYIFRPSNNLGHNTGFILTYDINNPIIWDKYHTPKQGSANGKLNLESYDTVSNKNDYYEGPTYYVTKDGVYGQRYYNQDDIIPGAIHDTYEGMGTKKPTTGQATVERAYVVTSNLSAGNNQLYTGAGTYLSQFGSTTWDGLDNSIKSHLDSAYICTSTLELGNDEYIYYGELVPASQYKKLTDSIADYKDYFDVAWYCTSKGNYGGAYYQTGNNYLGIDTWSSMSAKDRKNFKFNYDALDLLIDTLYRNKTVYYDSVTAPVNRLYSEIQSIDYIAIFEGELNRDYYDKDGQKQTITVNDTLTREEYESLPNEQYHYAPIKIEKHESDTTVYIVKTTFSNGGTILSVGKTVTKDVYDGTTDKSLFDIITMSEPSAEDITLYYCRDGYYINEHGTEDGIVRSITACAGDSVNKTKGKGDYVGLGFIIDQTTYRNNLPNSQTEFTVQGTAPVGTSTLIVSRESDIFNLSKGKVITVMYQYDYEESDESGEHIEPITEKHIVNIHIDFKSGVPFIDELGQPNIVLPGSTVGLKIPNVTPGAYEVISSGWEMFTNEEDANQHKNGIPYTNNATPMYWYQDGYLVAYYTKTYLGKTYSNAVPFSVANYHRMSDVIQSKHHETYIDRDNQVSEIVDTIVNDYMYLNEAVRIKKRDPKVYIRNLSEFNQFNAFFDTLTIGVNHDSLFAKIKNGSNIDFILDGDIAFKADSTWTPIGNATVGCFDGKLHGDGHTISGLNKSLFGSLCGTVYNLGVTGSFTGSGIADAGDGRAVNCWIITTGVVDSTQTAPILGSEGNVENGYYYNDYKSGVHDDAYKKGMKSFLNGEVAYNLNKFYLTKRYYDHLGKSAGSDKYTAWSKDKINVAGAVPDTAYYPTGTEKYVEQRYAYPDFIYAVGYIPESKDIRDKGTTPHSPIYPDDYIYFGQKLTYGIVTGGGEHQTTPGIIRKSSGLIVDGATGSRVYRTPAYYQNSVKSSVYFNSYAAFKDIYVTAGNDTIDIHKSMTAIDFSQYNDTDWSNDMDANGLFYTPITDYDRLRSYITDGLTQNMLVYFTEDPDSILLHYYHMDKELEFKFSNEDYGTVAPVEERAYREVKGHLVQEVSDNTYEAVYDHFLVDKQDYNAPISYTVPGGQYIWYQRVPETYVESMNAGWETISLPFTAEIVTTHQKGEITHFYQGSKTGHEYWLRKYQELDDDDNTKLLFAAPDADGTTKTVGNTFLWDYYYNNDKNTTDPREDANDDIYQQYYNDNARGYDKYPRYSAGVPYLIGFPGKRFYEFDLSGEWTVEHTATPAPEQLHQQYITFASSGTGSVIKVTDTEYATAASIVEDGLTYMPTYQAKTLAADSTYLLNKAGDKFQKGEVNKTVATVPFRAYLTSATHPANKASRRVGTRADVLYIGYAGDNDKLAETPVDRGLIISGQNMQISIESTLEEPATVTITTVAGRLLKQVVVQPGARVTVPVNNRGVYIVNRHKIAVTK